MQLSTAEKAAIDRDNRQYQLATATNFSDLLQVQVLNPLEAGSAGITADARDVNGVALTGMVATRDVDVANGSTLNFAWRAFRFHNGKALVTVAAGTIALSPSTTNYIEADRAGTVSRNTTGFTSGRMPLWQVTTAAASYADSGVVGRAAMYVLVGDDGVDGSMLSVAAQTKEVSADLILIPTAAGQTAGRLIVPSTIAAGSKLTKARFVSRDGLVASDVNYVTFSLVNKQTGAGNQILVDSAAAANSTRVTGGSALVADTPRDLTLVTLTAGTERDVTGGHVLAWTITGVGTLPNTLRECCLLLEFTFEN